MSTGMSGCLYSELDRRWLPGKDRLKIPDQLRRLLVTRRRVFLHHPLDDQVDGDGKRRAAGARGR